MRNRDDERRDYHGDAVYEVWRSGGNPDRVDYDRVEEHFWAGDSYESAARHELRCQRPPQEEEYPDYPEEEYPEEEFPAPHPEDERTP